MTGESGQKLLNQFKADLKAVRKTNRQDSGVYGHPGNQPGSAPPRRGLPAGATCFQYPIHV